MTSLAALLVATWVLPSAPWMSEAQVCERAAVVVRGVVSSKSHRKLKGQVIVTEIRLRVAEGYRPEALPDALSFLQLGGEVDGLTMTVPGQSRYTLGEEVILFLERGNGGLVEVGLGTGKFEVERPQKGRAFVRRCQAERAPTVVGGTDASCGEKDRAESLAAFERRLATCFAE